MVASLRASVVVLVSALTAALAPAGMAAPPPTVIRLVSVTVAATNLDRPPKGPSAGDAVRERSRLHNDVRQFGKARDAIVGSDRAIQRLRGRRGRTVTVDGVATLPGGTLRFLGDVRPDRRGGVVVPVVAGTGRYLGAKGVLWIVTVERPRRTLNVYRLTYALFA